MIGVREAVGVTGVCETLLLEDTGSGCVSRSNGDPLVGSFLDEELGKRNTDFQEDCGRGDGTESGEPLRCFELGLSMWVLKVGIWGKIIFSLSSPAATAKKKGVGTEDL